MKGEPLEQRLERLEVKAHIVGPTDIVVLILLVVWAILWLVGDAKVDRGLCLADRKTGGWNCAFVSEHRP
jgi:hypothetical protein